MTRERVILELDSDLVTAARAAAQRAGVPQDAVYERALRQVLVRDFAALMDDIARDQDSRGVALDDDEAMRTAVEEVRAVRAERGTP
jgi:hypothetical protein